ncbi:hypothetical protein SDC9_103423 [bioreactor metagenome]|uniref:Uncharacterized protein n=1 Tax=bioreactor metagenome TaxID=1076179 RepID=A0A645B4G1_9ZZZZ
MSYWIPLSFFDTEVVVTDALVVVGVVVPVISEQPPISVERVKNIAAPVHKNFLRFIVIHLMFKFMYLVYP